MSNWGWGSDKNVVLFHRQPPQAEPFDTKRNDNNYNLVGGCAEANARLPPDGPDVYVPYQSSVRGSKGQRFEPKCKPIRCVGKTRDECKFLYYRNWSRRALAFQQNALEMLQDVQQRWTAIKEHHSAHRRLYDTLNPRLYNMQLRHLALLAQNVPRVQEDLTSCTQNQGQFSNELAPSDAEHTMNHAVVHGCFNVDQLLIRANTLLYPSLGALQAIAQFIDKHRRALEEQEQKEQKELKEHKELKELKERKVEQQDRGLVRALVRIVNNSMAALWNHKGKIIFLAVAAIPFMAAGTMTGVLTTLGAATSSWAGLYNTLGGMLSFVQPICVFAVSNPVGSYVMYLMFRYMLRKRGRADQQSPDMKQADGDINSILSAAVPDTKLQLGAMFGSTFTLIAGKVNAVASPANLPDALQLVGAIIDDRVADYSAGTPFLLPAIDIIITAVMNGLLSPYTSRICDAVGVVTGTGQSLAATLFSVGAAVVTAGKAVASKVKAGVTAGAITPVVLQNVAPVINQTTEFAQTVTVHAWTRLGENYGQLFSQLWELFQTHLSYWLAQFTTLKDNIEKLMSQMSVKASAAAGSALALASDPAALEAALGKLSSEWYEGMVKIITDLDSKFETATYVVLAGLALVSLLYILPSKIKSLFSASSSEAPEDVKEPGSDRKPRLEQDRETALQVGYVDVNKGDNSVDEYHQDRIGRPLRAGDETTARPTVLTNVAPPSASLLLPNASRIPTPSAPIAILSPGLENASHSPDSFSSFSALQPLPPGLLNRE